MEMLGVNSKHSKSGLEKASGAPSPDQTIQVVKYTKSGEPVLKFGANSELPKIKLMAALRRVGWQSGRRMQPRGNALILRNGPGPSLRLLGGNYLDSGVDYALPMGA